MAVYAGVEQQLLTAGPGTHSIVYRSLHISWFYYGNANTLRAPCWYHWAEVDRHRAEGTPLAREARGLDIGSVEVCPGLWPICVLQPTEHVHI